MAAIADDRSALVPPRGDIVLQNRWMGVVSVPFGDDGEWFVVTRPDGSARRGAVALVTDGSHILMVRQFRPAVGFSTWELPGGRAEPGEALAVSGVREVEEETGVPVTGSPESLGILHADVGVLSDEAQLIFARTTRPARPASTDGEVDEVAWVPVGEVVDACVSGAISCAHTVAAVLRARARGLI